MAKLSLAAITVAALASGASAFAPASVSSVRSTSLKMSDEAADGMWDPLGLYNMESSADTFPNMFPMSQFIEEAEIKHGRMSMLAWTGVWATHQGGFGLGLHFPGFPVEPDWTKALGVFASEQPAWFGGILAMIAIAEGESVGHAGDNFRNMSSKEPGNLGLDYLGLNAKLSDERKAHYKTSERTNGRAAMIAMASLFAFESIPGSVPLMDLLGAN
jgi:light-harvesting complex I chlorophyll a/b binding protein 1